MRNNADLTIYNKYVDAATRTEKYHRSQIRGVLWENRKAANVIASGGNIAVNQANIYVPFQRGVEYLPYTEWAALTTKTGYWTFQDGDVVVRGLVEDTISASFTISDLKAKYPDVLTIRSVDTMDMGSYGMCHWQIGAS
jgi:hypothetical protein